MSRAFVKEADGAGDGRCPRCGAVGSAVSAETLDALIAPARRQDIGATGYFCAAPTCAVAYFDDFERVVEAEALTAPVYPKDPTAPICPCFGFYRVDIEADVAEGTTARCKEVVAKSRSDAARCAIRSPTGQACVPEIQRYFQKLRGG